jgi:hypothetical protein
MLCCKYESQHSLENNFKLDYGMCFVIIRTVHNNSMDTVVFHKTTKHANSVGVAIPNRHNLHSPIT